PGHGARLFSAGAAAGRPGRGLGRQWPGAVRGQSAPGAAFVRRGGGLMDLWNWLVQPFIEFGFMRRALAGAWALAFAAGPLGVFLVLRRLSLMGDAMAHAILPGVAVGFLTAGLSMTAMTLGGLVTGVAVAVLAGLVSRMTPLREDASFAAFYLVSLGLGVLLVSLKGTNMDLIH